MRIQLYLVFKFFSAPPPSLVRGGGEGAQLASPRECADLVGRLGGWMGG